MKLACRVERELDNEVRSNVGHVQRCGAIVQLASAQTSQRRRVGNLRASCRTAHVLLWAIQRNREGHFVRRACDKSQFRNTSPNEARLVVYVDVLRKEDVAWQ